MKVRSDEDVFVPESRLAFIVRTSDIIFVGEALTKLQARVHKVKVVFQGSLLGPGRAFSNPHF